MKIKPKIQRKPEIQESKPKIQRKARATGKKKKKRQWHVEPRAPARGAYFINVHKNNSYIKSVQIDVKYNIWPNAVSLVKKLK
jgi:hypothetical protein